MPVGVGAPVTCGWVTVAMMFAPVVFAAGVRPTEEVRTMLTSGFAPLAVKETD